MSRLIFGGIAILAEAVCLFIISKSRNGAAFPAKTLFYILIGLAVWYVLIAGTRSASDCVSREKREGTLGLLFLTDLKGYDVVIGKLVSNGLAVFYGFLAIFPVLGVSFLMGGVTGGEFFCATLAILNIVFVALAAGILASTLFTEGRHAFYSAAAFLFIVMVILPPIGRELMKNGYLFLGGAMLRISPITALQEAAILMGHYNYFWTDIVFSNSLVWVLLGFASWRIPNCWQMKNSRLGRRERLAQLSYGNSKLRIKLRNQLIEKNPYYWLISRKRFGKATVWGSLGVAAIVYVIVRFLHFLSPFPAIEDEIFLIFSLSHLLLLTWITSVASMYLDAFRRDGSLEFLLCATPLTTSGVLRGQWLGLKRLFLWPSLALVAADLFQFWEFYVRSQTRIESWGILFIMALFIISIFPAVWIAMWVGVSSSKPGHGASAALFRVLLIPLVIFGFLSSVTRAFGGNFAISFLFICVINDVLFGISAYCNLKDNLRKMAVPPMNDRGNFWNTTGRQVGEALGIKS